MANAERARGRELPRAGSRGSSEASSSARMRDGGGGAGASRRVRALRGLGEWAIVCPLGLGWAWPKMFFLFCFYYLLENMLGTIKKN